MKPVAWIRTDKGKNGNVGEGVGGLRAPTTSYFLSSSLESGASVDRQPGIETPPDPPPLSEAFGFAHRFPVQLSSCVAHEDGGNEHVVLCPPLLRLQMHCDSLRKPFPDIPLPTAARSTMNSPAS